MGGATEAANVSIADSSWPHQRIPQLVCHVALIIHGMYHSHGVTDVFFFFESSVYQSRLHRRTPFIGFTNALENMAVGEEQCPGCQ